MMRLAYRVTFCVGGIALYVGAIQNRHDLDRAAAFGIVSAICWFGGLAKFWDEIED